MGSKKEITSARPTRNDMGPYAHVEAAPGMHDEEAPNVIDASAFPEQSHPLLHISERVRKKTGSRLSEAAFTANLMAHGTGFGLNYGESTDSKVL